MIPSSITNAGIRWFLYRYCWAGMGSSLSSITIGFLYQANSQIVNFQSNLRKFPICELWLGLNKLAANSRMDFLDGGVSLDTREGRQRSAVCSLAASMLALSSTWLANFSIQLVCCVYTWNMAKQDSSVQCLQSHYCERQKPHCHVQWHKHFFNPRERTRNI